MYLEIVLADFAVFRVFWEFRGISRKYLNFAGPRPREISEALNNEPDNLQALTKPTFQREQFLSKRTKKRVRNWLKYSVCITKAIIIEVANRFE